MAVDPLPTVLIPALAASPRLFGQQIPLLWRFGPVLVADTKHGESISAVAQHILAAAPPRFALVGLSLGGYLAFDIVRQAPERVAKLALLDTSARPDTPEQTERRKKHIGMAEEGRYSDVVDQLFRLMVHSSRWDDPDLRRTVDLMAAETGPEAFIRQQKTAMSRPDSRPTLPKITCSTLVVVGDDDQLTPPPIAEEITKAVNGAGCVVIPKCGHLSTLERPEATSQALLDWLAR